MILPRSRSAEPRTTGLRATGSRATGRRARLLTAALAGALPLLAAAAAPAAAERLTGPTVGGAAATGVQSFAITGVLRLDTPSTITARARVAMAYSAAGEITLTVAGRTCRTPVRLAAGTATVTASCALVPTAAHVPQQSAGAALRLVRTGGGTQSTTRAVRAVIPVDDGAPVPVAVARQRWQALADGLRAELGAATAGGPVAAAQTGRVAGADDPGGAVAALGRDRLGATASTHSAAERAWRVWEESQRSGWQSPATQALVGELMAARKPSGGYGLDVAWDAYQDGSLNPASTTYTVTTAGHVGWILLEGYKHHALPSDGLTSAVDALLATPRLNGGTCIAYSSSPNDAAEPCVYNVTHGAAAFLTSVRTLTDYRAGEIDALLAVLRAHLTDGYDPASGYWVYMAGRTVAQDVSHQLYTARSVDVVDPGFQAVERMMAVPWWRHPNGLTQAPGPLASAMMDVARDCTRERSPAILLAARRALGSGAPTFSVMGMAAFADDILQRCFA